MADTRASAPILVRLRARWEARAKRRVCLTLHHWGLLKPLSFVQWLVTNRCNFSCAFCETSAGPRRLPDSCAGGAQVPTCGGGCWAELQTQGRCLKDLVDGKRQG